MSAKFPSPFDAQLLIFDWSGTISDDRKPVHAANNHMLEHYGLQQLTYNEWLSATTQNIFDFFLSKGIRENPDRLFAFYTECFKKVTALGIVPEIYPRTSETLEYLSKKKPLAVLSAHPEESIIEEAVSYGISDYFKIILGNSRDKISGLTGICSSFSIKPENAVYIADTTFDIESARAVSMLQIAVCTGYHAQDMLRQKNPTLLLPSVSELRNCF